MTNTTKPKVYFVNPYHQDAIKLSQDSPQVDTVVLSTPSGWHADANGILLRSETRITKDDIAQAKSLKVIVKQGVGVDNIDIAAAKDAGVIVCNTPAMNSESVAELTITLALTIARRVVEIDRLLKRGEKLVRSKLLGQSLFEKTIGIIGMGAIGKSVAQKWIGAMNGKVIAYDPFAPEGAWSDIKHQRVTELDALLKDSDVITLHVPLTDGTKGMIGKREFKLVKNNAILLNAARGGIVDEDALLEALETKQIFGAALDAQNVEPPSLEKHKKHLEQDNLILTPHVGASTEENQSNSGKFAVQTILDVLAGKEVPNRVA
ncbi:hypothetical protein M409DRAFT_35348 [Zasmidium cellare ATCC 36951]|uniref:D-3-phosphoglycerate dehydrogenase n=1 Tax=Zasmidium cellare ATCC 36951 TaxID=1080233 RepID=A0A6A6D6X9_ZASCE|nr:uncharacterized protein M409DRAFT_35348 [Zasmidium cellare ATCC 36951]KAF2173992.1 hypothetical protein M409DRAFT_35348 [Zasmidium cellare ATCC 36951]